MSCCGWRHEPMLGDQSGSVRRWENGPVGTLVVHKPHPCSQSYWSCLLLLLLLLVITTATPQLIIIIIIIMPAWSFFSCLITLSLHQRKEKQKPPKKKKKFKSCSKSVRILTSQQLLPKLVQPQDWTLPFAAESAEKQPAGLMISSVEY